MRWPRQVSLSIVFLLSVSASAGAQVVPPLAPLPKLKQELDPAHINLGRRLFFDNRLSGDATISCATCHDPKKNWTDGLALSNGYPGTLYFRNTPTVINAGLGRYLYWDGRLPTSDLATLVRDHISEAHFFQADGRLVIERLRQVPEYEQGFKSAFGGEPTYGRILDAVAAFVSSLQSTDVPFDNFLNGDSTAISDAAKRGLELFGGKAGCLQCHNGPMLSDTRFHSLGLETNQDIFKSPLRHITFRRYFRMLGVTEFSQLRQDIGLGAVTKQRSDRERFRTPTLREVAGTAPYMHGGQLATLGDVVKFYNSGGGPRTTRASELKPLGLTDAEQADLVEFLKTLSGKPIEIKPGAQPDYQLRIVGDNS